MSINEEVQKLIRDVGYVRVNDTTTIICAIETTFGFVAVGKSACINPEDFDAEIERKYAYEDAFDKLVECYAFFIKYTNQMGALANKLLTEHPEFHKMSDEQRKLAIDDVLGCAADPANGESRGHFINLVNAANALKAQQ